jgi:cysteine desulfurase
VFRLQRDVYFDNNATTAISRRVNRRMARVLRRHHGNPSSLYRIAREAAAVIEESREVVARTINAEANEVFFTGSASEANNHVLKALSEIFHPRKRKIVSSPIEHPSVMSSLEYLEGKGIRVQFMPVDKEGRVLIESLEDMLDDDTFLVCCVLANNEIGTIQELRRISEISKEHGVLVMSDCVQALGKIPLDVEDLGIDYATFSAHKLHGPKGIGALFVREGSPFQPLIHGGHQEAGMRAGTEAVHSIAGFAEACRGVGRLLSKRERTAARKRAFIDELRKVKPDIALNSPPEDCLPNTASITFPGCNNALLMANLDLHGVSVSAGSACSTSEIKPSHVLKAIGLSDEQANETLRLSISEDTSLRDVRYVVGVLRDQLEEGAHSIRILRPAQADRAFLFDQGNYILDIRFWHERKLLKSLPNSFEASFIGFRRYIHHVPRDKHVLVVCMGGFDAVFAAVALRSRGFEDVSVLLTGVAGWRIRQSELYRRYAGLNVTKLEPRKARRDGSPRVP